MKILRTLDDLPDLTGKTVLVRADLNVPIENGEVTSNYRIVKAAATIKELTERQARVVVMSHLGRPEGEYKDEFSLMPVRFELGKILDSHIKFAHPRNSKNSVIFMENGEVLLLENLRFDAAETAKTDEEREEFTAILADLADYYVNDAFGSYSAHASTYNVALKFEAPVAGRLMEKEVEVLGQLRDNVEKPYVAVIGGVKLDTKIPILKSLIHKADTILIGGAMAYTFLKAQGINVGKSVVEEDKLEIAKEILEEAKSAGCEIYLPIDHVAGKEFAESAEKVEVDTQQIPEDLMALDIGERTLSLYLEKIKSASTIMWNGPMGVFEWESFARGTEAIGEYIALSASRDTFKVAGGGDTIAAMTQLKINFKNFNHVSTGGGAMLDFLAGDEFKVLEPLYK